jgi:hypothetical protein
MLQTSDPILNYNLGLSLMFEQATDQAREQFERALQLKPDFVGQPISWHFSPTGPISPKPSNAGAITRRWHRVPAEHEWVARATEQLQQLQRP